MIDIRVRQERIANFLTSTEQGRRMAEKCRDYKDGKQWTEVEAAKLNARGQAPIVNNMTKSKVEGLKGLFIQRRTDPKGYSRTQQDEKASEVVTDGLRYVGDASNFKDTVAEVSDNLIVEGYGGVIVDIEDRKDGVFIAPTHIPWDRIYFDHYSRRHDFNDSMVKGLMTWMFIDAAKQLYKGKEKEIDEAVTNLSYVDETFEDKPAFSMVSDDRKRVMIAHEFSLEDGVWTECVFAGDQYLIDPRPSIYKDEDNEPTCPIELVHAYIDRDNQRYGEVASWLDLQDEINHRRSRFLFLLSSRQTRSKKGSIADIKALKRELSKPDGHVEVQGDAGDFDVLQTGDMANAQFELYQDAKQSLDASSFNAQLAGERQGNLSGVAVSALQSAGMLETNALNSRLMDWKTRVYRQIWARMKQYWTQEKWIRVTDDFDKLRWIGMNVPVTAEVYLKDIINDKANPQDKRQKAAMLLTQMVQAQDPRLQEVVTVKNPIPKLDMDIILDHAPDSLNVQQEQFAMLFELAKTREIPLKSLLKLSQLRGKEDIISDIEKEQQAAMAGQQEIAQLDKVEKQLTIEGKQIDNAGKMAGLDKTAAETADINMSAISKQVKNQVMMANPDPTPQAIV